MHRTRKLWHSDPSCEAGVSFWEVLLAILIVAGVFAYAFPKFRVMRVKAFQSDARLNLINLDKLQQDYHFEHDVYADDLSKLKFRPSNAGVYDYKVLSADDRSYEAEASAPAGKLESCAGEDSIVINHDKMISQTKDGSDGCDGLNAFKK